AEDAEDLAPLDGQRDGVDRAHDLRVRPRLAAQAAPERRPLALGEQLGRALDPERGPGRGREPLDRAVGCQNAHALPLLADTKKNAAGGVPPAAAALARAFP